MKYFRDTNIQQDRQIVSHYSYIFQILWPPRDFTKLIGVATGNHNSLWPKATMFYKSQRDYSWIEATTKWSDCLKPDIYFSNFMAPQRLNKTYWVGHRTPQFFVAIGYNVWKVTNMLFMNGGHHKMVRLSQTRLIFLKCCGHPENHKNYWGGHRTQHFFVAIGHNDWQVTMRLFMNGGHHNMVRVS